MLKLLVKSAESCRKRWLASRANYSKEFIKKEAKDEMSASGLVRSSAKCVSGMCRDRLLVPNKDLDRNTGQLDKFGTDHLQS